ncbi:SAM-dependent methyltransferase [Deinococcus petrolearius]|uniref:SAM-dependent methyltransferase n=1 Tax=Deinococcus petrolearius TaxID=1751295 RepID=A0ABW1DED8_9DEIO
MDFLRFFTIVEAERDSLNPIGSDQLDRLATAVGLQDGQRVLDVGSGKGALSRRWAMRTALQGTGVDLNPAFVASAREWAGAQGLAGHLTFLEGAALDLWPTLEAQGPYDVATCLGATFALGGFGPTLEHLHGVLRPGGTLVVGDVFLAAPATPEALAAEGWADLPTLAARREALAAAGLDLNSLIVSGQNDWDHYSRLAWSAARRWAEANPEDPDRAEVLWLVAEGQARYLRFEREHLGWAVFVARVDE